MLQFGDISARRKRLVIVVGMGRPNLPDSDATTSFFNRNQVSHGHPLSAAFSGL